MRDRLLPEIDMGCSYDEDTERSRSRPQPEGTLCLI